MTSQLSREILEAKQLAEEYASSLNISLAEALLILVLVELKHTHYHVDDIWAIMRTISVTPIGSTVSLVPVGEAPPPARRASA